MPNTEKYIDRTAPRAKIGATLQKYFSEGKLRGNRFYIGSLAGEAGDGLCYNIISGFWFDCWAPDQRGDDLVSLIAAAKGITRDAALDLLLPELGYK